MVDLCGEGEGIKRRPQTELWNVYCYQLFGLFGLRETAWFVQITDDPLYLFYLLFILVWILGQVQVLLRTGKYISSFFSAVILVYVELYALTWYEFSLLQILMNDSHGIILLFGPWHKTLLNLCCIISLISW